MTRVASRRAGVVVGFLLVFLGLFGKFGAAFVLIPWPVIGAALTICFGLMLIGGLSMVAHGGFTQRKMFILACAIGISAGIKFAGTVHPNSLAAWNCEGADETAHYLQAINALDIAVRDDRYIDEDGTRVCKLRDLSFTVNTLWRATYLIISSELVLAFLITVTLNLILPKTEEDYAAERRMEKEEMRGEDSLPPAKASSLLSVDMQDDLHDNGTSGEATPQLKSGNNKVGAITPATESEDVYAASPPTPQPGSSDSSIDGGSPV